MADITVKYSKKYDELFFKWSEGNRGLANILMTDVLDTRTQKMLENNGFDLTSLKFSINRKQQENQNDK